MNRTSQRGFVTVLALASLSMLMAAAVIITQMTFALKFQSDREYVAACERNLAASALAWSQGRQLEPKSPENLDVSALKIPGGLLTVSPAKAGKSNASVRIELHCRVGQFHLNRSDVYALSASPK